MRELLSGAGLHGEGLVSLRQRLVERLLGQPDSQPDSQPASGGGGMILRESSSHVATMAVQIVAYAHHGRTKGYSSSAPATPLPPSR